MKLPPSNQEIKDKVSEKFGGFYNPSQLYVSLDHKGRNIVGKGANDKYMIMRITGKEGFSASKQNLEYLAQEASKLGYEIAMDAPDYARLK